MVLTKIDENNFPITPTPLQMALSKRLEEGKVRIFYRINKTMDKITYLGADDYFGTFCIKVGDDGKVEIGEGTSVPCFHDENEYENLINTFLRYLIRKDKEAPAEMLERRYGRLSRDYTIFKDMSLDDIQQYKENRAGLSHLLEELKDDKDNDSSMNGPTAGSYSIRIDFNPSYPSQMEFRVFRKDGKQDSLTSFFSIYNYFFADHPELLTPVQKDIFAQLTPLMMEARLQGSYRYIDPKIANGILFRILPLLGKQEVRFANPIRVSGIDFRLEDEIRHLEVSIDENGEIQTNFPDSSSYYVCRESMQILEVDEAKRTLSLYQYPNEKVRKLFCFRHDHPQFSSKLFLDDISVSVIPAIKGQVPVESTFLSKSLMRIDHIEYYVDLDKDRMELDCKTKYCLDKKFVEEEEYQRRYPEKIEGFKNALSSYSMKENGRVKDPDVIVAFVSSSMDDLKKYAQLFVSEELKKLHKKSVGKINIAINSGNDWFSLDFSSDEYTKEEVDSILDAYKKKKKYFLLRGSILSLEEEGDEDIKEILDDLDFKNKHIPMYQVLKLNDRKNVDLGEDVRALFHDILRYEETEIHLLSTLQASLRPYQVKGVQWLTALKEHHLSGILADDMGLGKTLEMIAFLSQYDEKKPNLIVTPKSLTFNWEDEFHRWNKAAKVVVLSLDREERHSLIAQIKKEETVNYIISYDSLRIDLDLLKDVNFGFVILDEGQNIANALSQRARAVKSLNADYKFALTGTPIQNSLMDLWSLFDFLMPGYLRSFNDFKRQYAKYDIEKKERDHLEHIVSPFLLKRKKDDVLKELPGKTVVTQSIVMEKKEKDLYNAYLMKAKNTFHEKGEGGKTKKLEVLAALTRLRQICVDPSSFLEYKDLSTKLDYTLFLIREAIAKGHKVLLFSSFKTVLIHLGELLEKEHITYDFITGDTSAQARLQLAKKFNQGEDPKVMLISLKAGGTGLNLIGADIVVHLDPWWNLAAEDQASDRAYRIGQKRKVTIYKIVMKNTIEEKVLVLQEKKKNLSDIFDNASEKTNLSDEDIAYLLG